MQEMPSATKLNGINRLAYTAPDKAPGTRTAAAYLELHQTFSPLFFYLGLWEGRGGAGEFPLLWPSTNRATDQKNKNLELPTKLNPGEPNLLAAIPRIAA